MNRRTFLIHSSGLVAGLGLVGCADGPPSTQQTGLADSSSVSPGSENLFKISLAQWSLHRTIQGGQMDHLDFARTAKQTFGIDGVEYVNTFFMDKATDAAYLSDMKSRADGEGVTSILIMCDNEGPLGSPEESLRTQAVQNHYKWIDAAKALGCHSIRVNAFSAGTYDEQMRLVADGMRRLAEHGEQQGINVLIENHGGLSSNAQWVAGVVQLADHPRLGTLPDPGNFDTARTAEGAAAPYDPYQGVDEMMPYAKGVSAEFLNFDAQGNESAIDYRRVLETVLRHGYNGYVGIEYEGQELSEQDGITAAKRVLERVRNQLATAA